MPPPTGRITSTPITCHKLLIKAVHKRGKNAISSTLPDLNNFKQSGFNLLSDAEYASEHKAMMKTIQNSYVDKDYVNSVTEFP